MILALLFIFIVLPNISKVPDVTIPDVNNYTVETAEKELEKLGLDVNVDVIEKASDKVEEGKVIATNPSKGRTVKAGTSITLIISTGMKKYKVEDLTGKNYIEIKTLLTEMYGIEVNVEEKEVKDTNEKKYDKQEIVAQDVEPGTELKAGDKIIIYIPKKVEKYPNFVTESWTVEKVSEWANEKGVSLVVEYKETDDYEPGVIIEQSREADSVVTSGATFKIVVAKARTNYDVTPDKPDDSNVEGE